MGTGFGVRASHVAQLVKNLPAMWETPVRFLGRVDPLEKGMATHPVFLTGEFHGLYSSWGHKESDMTEQLHFHLHPSECRVPKNSKER